MLVDQHHRQAAIDAAGVLEQFPGGRLGRSDGHHDQIERLLGKAPLAAAALRASVRSVLPDRQGPVVELVGAGIGIDDQQASIVHVFQRIDAAGTSQAGRLNRLTNTLTSSDKIVGDCPNFAAVLESKMGLSPSGETVLSELSKDCRSA